MIPVTPGVTVKVVVLTVAVFIASLKVTVMTPREHTPVAPLTGETETPVGVGLHPCAALLKLHTKSVARILSKLYLNERVILAVHTRRSSDLLDGVKVKMVLLTS